MNFLEFERPIAELEAKIEELRHVSDAGELNIGEEITRLQKKSHKLTESIFASLSPWQIVQLARHPSRPYTSDYIERIFTNFNELHGDRHFSDDPAVTGGIGELDGRGVVVIGHQKGRDVNDKVRRNFGMPRPEGYRKARRLMGLADRFGLPVVCFIDTPGAYPGIGAEERGQSEAIAGNLFMMASLGSPIVAIIIGEGGSGGALAIGVADRTMMLEYATYSVISPEGCASILWKDTSEAPQAAQAMGVTSKSLIEQGMVDAVIDEPLGGAHRDYDATAAAVGTAIRAALSDLCALPKAELIEQRRLKYRAFGEYSETA